MVSKDLTKQFEEGRAKTNSALVKLARVPIVSKQEEAETFNRGLVKLMQLPRETRKALSERTVDELSKEKGIDADVAKAMRIIEKSLTMISDAITKTPNTLIKGMAEVEAKAKTLHTEQMTRTEAAVLEISNIQDLFNTNLVDSGYLAAFETFNALDRTSVRLRDLFLDFQLQELGEAEEPSALSAGGETSEEMSYRRFGGAVRLNDWHQRHAILGANQILAAIRLASLKMNAWVGYKALHMESGNFYDLKPFTEEAAEETPQAKLIREVMSANHTLNYGYEHLIRHAGNIPESPANGPARSEVEASLPVNMQTPVMLFYNPVQAGFIRRMQSITLGQALRGDGMTEELYRPIIFAESHMAPVSGGWKLKQGGRSLRDGWGAMGQIEEAGSTSEVAGRMIIPGIRNAYVAFQGLNIGVDRMSSTESTTISAFERYAFYVESRQSYRVRLRGPMSKTGKK